MTAATLLAVCVLAASPVRAPLDSLYRDTAERLIGAALASDHAMLRLSQLCDGIGYRLTGSANLERAVGWAARAMREDGLVNVRTQAARVPHWVRGEEHAEMVSPRLQKLFMLGLGRSVGTPRGGITAQVVAVDSFAALDALPDTAISGRIVLYDVPFKSYGETVRYRSEGANRAAARGAMAALVRSVGPVSLRTPHTGAMAPYVDSLPRIPAAAVTIEDVTMMRRLLSQRVPVRVHLEMNAQTLPDTISHNVIGEIRGRERPDEVVVLSGHLDSWDVGAGAQDDGGGCVISMEALRIIKRLGLRPRRTLRVVLWTNEENGTRGAQAYADSLKGAVAGHVAAIESDGGVERVVGFDFGANKIGTDTADVARTNLALARAREIEPLLAGIGANRFGPGGGGADIGHLMKLGVLGIEHTTTMEHYFDWHHTQADTPDKVDPIELRKNVAAMAVMAFVLADMPEPLIPPPPAPRPAPRAARPTSSIR